MIRQSSWDRGDLHKSARVFWDYFVGLITCPSNKDLISAAECPQPVREGALGSGRWGGGGGPWAEGQATGRAAQVGHFKIPGQHFTPSGRPYTAPSCQHTKSTCFQDFLQLGPS